MIIEETRFNISRVVFKDNSSYYMIDGRKVQFKEVSKKLQDVGIDLRYNRFLILQGEVEQISLMKPKSEKMGEVGMLEYLEDIIGTSRYIEPIEKLDQKYFVLNEERTKHMLRVKVSAKELKSVRNAKCEAVRSFELENERKMERAKLYQYHSMTLKSKLEKYENEYNEVKTQMNSLLEEENEIQAKVSELESEQKTKTAEYDELKKRQLELKEKFNECSKNDYYLNTKLKSEKEKLKILKTQIEDNRKKLTKLKESPDKKDKQIENLKSDSAKIEEDLKEVEDKIKEETQNAQSECADLIAKRDQLDNWLMKFKDDQSDKLSKMNEAHNNFSIIKQQIDTAQNKYDQLCSKMKTVTEETSEKQKHIEKYREEIPQQKSKLTKISKELQNCETKRSELGEVISSKNDEVIQLKRDASKKQSNDMVRNALMAEMRKGTLQGIYGRLGELGAIDKKYDVAVSTACGRLKNFVVDTIDNAQKCVEFLKQNNLPTVTFIALDKLRVHWREDQQFPENVPRLFDLVRVNDEYIRPAFYFSLGDTLVANDLDQASRIAYGTRPYRVVTLKGDMIEMDGSMSGGGQPRSGGMGTSVKQTKATDQSVIDKLEQQLVELRSEREQLDSKIESITRDLHLIERDIKFMEEKLQMYQMEVSENEKRLSQYKDNLKTQKEELKRVQENSELDVAEKLYNKAKSIYEKEAEKMTSKEDEMRQIDEEIREKLDASLQPIKKRKKNLEKKLKESQAKLNQILSEMKTHELTLKKTEETLSGNEESLKETEAEIEDIVAKVAELEVNAKQISEDYNDANVRCSAFDKEIKKIRTNMQDLDGNVKKISKHKLDLEHEMEKRFKVVDERRQKVNEFEQLLNAIDFEYLDDLYSDDEAENLSTEKPEVDTSPSKKCTPKLVQLTPEELKALDPQEIERNIESIGAELKKLNPNFGAIKEYRKKKAEHKEKVNQLDSCTSKRDTYMEHLRETKNRRLKEFKTGFIIIARKLKELYRTITLGGDADLEFIDSLDPFSEGINFAVRPNKKSWKNNMNLSGGEKTLASLALIFALHHYKPSPLYIMDEIDAALDFKNVSIIANYIKQRTRHTQFLIVSLRNNMYDLADRLIGIYKTFNVTKTIAFDPVAFEKRLKDGGVKKCKGLQETIPTSSQYSIPIPSSQSTHTLEYD